MKAAVKVQRPLNGPQDHYLVYDQDRTHVVQQPATTEMDKRMRGFKKAYFKGTYRYTSGLWSIGTRVPDQDW